MVRLSLWIGTLLVYQCSLVDGNQCYMLTRICLDCVEFQSSLLEFFFNSRERPSSTMSVRVCNDSGKSPICRRACECTGAVPESSAQ